MDASNTLDGFLEKRERETERERQRVIAIFGYLALEYFRQWIKNIDRH